MAESKKKRCIAILGAGPIGLEAALYARALDHDFKVYERGMPGENVTRWGFVRLFSPWKLNVSPLGLEEIRRAGQNAPDPEIFPTGRELCERYLDPIARSLGARIATRSEVLQISRLGLLKGDHPGGKRRGSAPFRILLREAGGAESEVTADVVIDATGVYSNPSWLGDGGIPALGETGLRDRIDYHLADVRGADRSRFAGKSVLLVGGGFSAATSLSELMALQHENPATRIVWARRSTGPDPFPLFPGDPLPERARLAREGNRVAAEPPSGMTVHSGVTVRAVSREGGEGDPIRVDFRPVEGGGMPASVRVDRILANVGYRPAIEIFRELQVHQCYASEGPMSLAAALLGGGGGDCLSKPAFGRDTLKNPEPDFFVIGHKSYGRRSDYLLRAGREQIRDVFQILEDDADLDLYAVPSHG